MLICLIYSGIGASKRVDIKYREYLDGMSNVEYCIEKCM